MTTSKKIVIKHLQAKIDEGYTQMEIAKRLGYPNPNFVSMLMSDKYPNTLMSMNKLKALSAFCALRPMDTLSLALSRLADSGDSSLEFSKATMLWLLRLFGQELKARSIAHEMLMMTSQEYNQLMEAKLAELESGNDSATSDTWLDQTLTPEQQQDRPMDNEERAVLQAFRKARQKYPRGLYFDSDEPGLLTGVLDQLLLRAQRLQEEEDASDTDTLISKEKLSAVINQLKQALQSGSCN